MKIVYNDPHIELDQGGTTCIAVTPCTDWWGVRCRVIVVHMQHHPTALNPIQFAHDMDPFVCDAGTKGSNRVGGSLYNRAAPLERDKRLRMYGSDSSTCTHTQDGVLTVPSISTTQLSGDVHATVMSRSRKRQVTFKQRNCHVTIMQPSGDVHENGMLRSHNRNVTSTPPSGNINAAIMQR
eukprot:m.645337 g.645337  ORF g.645337 m.645337 type:complete len:181 (+) comp22651_c0_seq9:3463-4005(+)